MIETRFDETTPGVHYILRPNQSWTWRANVWFLGILCTVSLTIALAFTWFGMWMILPWSLFELSALTFCLWLCVRRGYRQEVIVLQPESVHFQQGQRQQPPRITLERTFERFFTRFHVERHRHPWRDPRLKLCCRGEQIEIGAFLPAEEKQSLIAALRRGIRYVDAGSRQ
jgi:uncharacterized membrane protein